MSRLVKLVTVLQFGIIKVSPLLPSSASSEYENQDGRKEKQHGGKEEVNLSCLLIGS